MSGAVTFDQESVGARVVFGRGRAGDALELAETLGRRPMLIATASARTVAGDLVDDLRRAAVDHVDRVRRHVPADDAAQSVARARDAAADCLIALGGGSAIGLAKAVALEARLPILAVPTTYSGSEMTPVWGITRDGVKTTGRDTVVAPRIVIYDPALTRALPARITAASGLNALAHCVDALWAPARSPLSDTMAERAIVALTASLPAAVADGADEAAREEMLVGAWLAAATFALAGSSLHHKLCHVLGGRFDLPHAETHAAVLPWSTRFALQRQPTALAVMERATSEDPVRALLALATAVGAPTALGQLGVTEAQAIETAADIPLDRLAVPFPVSRQELQSLLLDAVRGELR
jgi:maleylacetate reductase